MAAWIATPCRRSRKQDLLLLCARIGYNPPV